MGNHAAYDTSCKAAKSAFHSFSPGNSQRRNSNPAFGYLIFLDQTGFDISENVTILGCTLYSLISPEQAQSVQLVSDFEQVE
jgi:hypothetical protein